jgi:acetolactate synthase-1/3 small subunit
MKRNFIIHVTAENNFSILNRIINVLNRRRVRIKKLLAHEDEYNFRRGGASLLVYTTPEMAEKVKQQLEKLIEVEEARYFPAPPLHEDWINLYTDKSLTPSVYGKINLFNY